MNVSKRAVHDIILMQSGFRLGCQSAWAALWNVTNKTMPRLYIQYQNISPVPIFTQNLPIPQGEEPAVADLVAACTQDPTRRLLGLPEDTDHSLSTCLMVLLGQLSRKTALPVWSCRIVSFGTKWFSLQKSWFGQFYCCWSQSILQDLEC